MDSSKKNSETELPQSEVDPTKTLEHVTAIDRERLVEEERELVLSDPEYVGLNLDQFFIVDGRMDYSFIELCTFLIQRDGKLSDELHSAIASGVFQDEIDRRKESEKEKLVKFNSYISSFGANLQHVRINPAGEFSPVSPAHAIKEGVAGGYDVCITSSFIRQLELLREHCTDITLVVPFYDHRLDLQQCSDVPETDEQVNRYVGLCMKVAELTGSTVHLELGNETNITRNSAPRFEGLVQHATKSDPLEYAAFYYKVAKQLKTAHPLLKLSIAGTALYDPTYIRSVLTEVKRLQEQDGVSVQLVDRISFHPYREVPEHGSAEVQRGKIIPSPLTFEQQVDEMQKIAKEFGAMFTVGEINFLPSDKQHREKLKASLDLVSRRKIVSLIYPGINME